MNADTFFHEFGRLAEAPEGVHKLRKLALLTAVEGRLVRQNPDDEPAEELRNRIWTLKSHLQGQRRKRNSQQFAPIGKPPYRVPKGWAWVRFGEVQLFTNGYAFKSTQYQDEGVGIVRIGDIQGGIISKSRMKAVGAECLRTLDPACRVEPGDLVVAMSGATTGKLGFNRTEETFLLNQRVGKIELIEVNARFAFYYLTTKIEENLKKSFGSAIPNLSTKQINELLFPLPPLPEQKRIVAKVDELMALCDELEKRQQKKANTQLALNRSCLDSLLKSENDQAFNLNWNRIHKSFELLYDNLENVGKLREAIRQLAVSGRLAPRKHDEGTGMEAVRAALEERARLAKKGMLRPRKEQIAGSKTEALFQIPEHWVWAKLADVCHVITDGEHLTPKYSASGVPMLSAKHVGQESLILEDYKTVSQHVAERCWLRCHPEPRDLLVVSRGGGVGRAIVSRATGYCLMGSVLLFKPASSINEEFLLSFLNSEVGNRRLRNTSGASAQQAIYISHLKRSYIVPVPPTAEQDRIVLRVNELFDLCNQLESKLEHSRSAAEKLLDSIVHHITAA